MSEQLRPARSAVPWDDAEFLLSNAVDEADYVRARQEVVKLGVDPDSIRHVHP